MKRVRCWWVAGAMALATALVPACGGGLDGPAPVEAGPSAGEPVPGGPGGTTPALPGSDSTPPAQPGSVPEHFALTVSVRPIKTLAFEWTGQPGTTSYRLLEDIDGDLGPGTEKLMAELPAGTTRHETDVFLPARTQARYWVQACGASGCVESVRAEPGSLVSAIGYFKASVSAASNEFGQSVALSADGRTLAVGTAREAGAGAVYLYHRGAAGWVLQARLAPPEADEGDDHGFSLALSANGNRLVVGASGDDSARNGFLALPSDNNLLDSGVAYTYDRNGAGEWRLGQRLKGWHVRAGDQAGYAVALSADGRTLAVSAHAEKSEAGGIDPVPAFSGTGIGLFSGAVYVFTHDGTQWLPQSYLKAEVPGHNDLFGRALALSASGDSLLVAAPREAGGIAGVNATQTDDSAPGAGAAYVFARDGLGRWRQQAYLKPPVVRQQDQFGRAVQMSADGRTVVVGADWEGGRSVGVNGDPAALGLLDAGAAHVFVLADTGWTHEAYLKAPNTFSGQYFGQSLALSGDGQVLAVGAYDQSAATGFDGDMAGSGAVDSGAAFLFRRNASGAWTASTYVKAPNTHADAYMGWSSMAFSADGQSLAIGVTGDYSAATGVQGDQTDRSAKWSGAVLLY